MLMAVFWTVCIALHLAGCQFEKISGPLDGGCVPSTCSDLGANVCGWVNDGCGGEIECLSCGRSGEENEDGCVTWTCLEIGATCGVVPDGCDGELDCGECAAGEICGSSGFENVCCLPTTCLDQSADCGQICV
mgnify:CR=1 FL=1